jgi:hypothetical protein
MENKTKGKHRGALDQYVDFLLKVQNCNYPFMDNIRKSDKRDDQKSVDKLNLVHDEPGDISNKTYEKLTSDIIKSRFKDMGEKEARVDIKKSLTSPYSACRNITEDPTAECVYLGRKYKGNVVGYIALEDYIGVKKGTKSFMKREGSNAYLFKKEELGYIEVLHGLDWKFRFKKITKFGEDLIPVTSSAKLVKDKVSTIKFGAEELRNMQDVDPTKSKNTSTTPVLSDIKPSPKKYDKVIVYTFTKDLVIDSDTKEYIPKGFSTYCTSKDSKSCTVKSNLGAIHSMTRESLEFLEENCISRSYMIKPVSW